MNKLPTAQELFDKMIEDNQACNETEMMIAFAAIHVEAALKSAADNSKIERISDSKPNQIFDQDNYGQLCISGFWAGQYIRINKNSILNSYLLENIK